MCLYCNPEDDNYKWKSIPINLGELGQHSVDVSLNPGRELMIVELRREKHAEPMWEGDISIRYCPYCGRRLRK